MTRPLRHARSTALMALGAVTAALLTAPALATTPARADGARELTVVGPGAFVDSHLWDDVLEPQIEAALRADGSDPVSVDYVARDGDEAIAYARTGAADVLLFTPTSTPGAEGDLVDDGYAGVGRSLLWTDAVLLGDASDPGRVRSQSPGYLPRAFERVAAVAAAGRAEFVAVRGPGTIPDTESWVGTGVTTCMLSEEDGGHAVPSTVSGPCPSPVPYASWYHVVDGQAAAIRAAEACEGWTSSVCYVLSDRGTSDYLAAQGELTDLRVVSRDEQRASSGSAVFPYQAYAIEQDKFAGDPSVSIDTAAAELAIASLVDNTYGGPARTDAYLERGRAHGPYYSAAVPAVGIGLTSDDLTLGELFSLSGRVSDPLPEERGQFDGMEVELGYYRQTADGPVPVVLDTATTDINGSFDFGSQAPHRTQDYYVATPGAVLVDEGPFGLGFAFQPRDPAHSSEVRVGTIVVRSRLDRVVVRRGQAGRFRVRAVLAPASTGTSQVTLYAGRPGRPRTQRDRYSLRPGTRSIDRTFRLAPGRWNILVRYVPGARGVGGTESADYASRIVLP